MSADLIEQLFLPAFGVPRMPASATRRCCPPERPARDIDRHVRGEADVLSRRQYRRSGRQRHGQRSRHGRRPAALPVDGVHPGRRHRWPTSARWRPRSAKAAERAGVHLVTGDTRSSITTAATAYTSTPPGWAWCPTASTSGPIARPGDVVLISGAIGEHGVAVMSVRDGIDFDTPVRSDTAPLHELVAEMIATGADIHVLRDPTRGGVSATINELARAADIGIGLLDRALPIPEEVRDACGLLGLDPLEVANEGKLLAIVPADDADRVLAAMRRHPLGRTSLHHRSVHDRPPQVVTLRTGLGATRVLTPPIGEQLPASADPTSRDASFVPLIGCRDIR